MQFYEILSLIKEGKLSKECLLVDDLPRDVIYSTVTTSKKFEEDKSRFIQVYRSEVVRTVRGLELYNYIYYEKKDYVKESLYYHNYGKKKKGVENEREPEEISI